MDELIGVSGAAGHLGYAVCRFLKEQGRQVRALIHRPAPWLDALGVQVVQGDVLDPESVSSFVQGCTGVIHCAGVVSISGGKGGRVWRTNAEGPRIMATACLDAGVSRLVHVSSVHAVLELPLDQVYDESRPYKSSGYPVYDLSKAAGEQAVLELAARGLDVVIVRPSAIVGPWDYRPSRLGDAVTALYCGSYPLLVGGGYDFVDVRDLAAGVIAALDRGRRGRVYLLSGTYRNLVQLARIVQACGGKPAPRLVAPFCLVRLGIPFLWLWARLTRTEPLFTSDMIKALQLGHPHMDSSRARNELGYTTRPLEQTLADAFAWKKAEGFMP